MNLGEIYVTNFSLAVHIKHSTSNFSFTEENISVQVASVINLLKIFQFPNHYSVVQMIRKNLLIFKLYVHIKRNANPLFITEENTNKQNTNIIHFFKDYSIPKSLSCSRISQVFS